MHPLDKLIKKYNMQSRYEFSKLTDIPQTSLARIVSNNIDALKVQTVIRMAKPLDITPGQLLDLLLDFEKED